jgi:hypothetical protein
VFRGTTQCTSRGSEQQKVISQSANEECSCPPAGSNIKHFQNILAKTKNMQTQEVVMDKSRSPAKSYKRNTYETKKKLLMLLLQTLVRIELLMFNCRTLSYLDPRFCTENCIGNVSTLSFVSNASIKPVMKCSYRASAHLGSDFCILAFDI